MSKFRNFSLAFGTYFIFSIFMTNVYGFASSTHEYVTRTGLSILHDLGKTKEDKEKDNDKESNTSDQIDEKVKSIYDDFYTDEVKDILLEYCVKPDEDEIEGGFKWHFYNPATELNFMGEKESALTKFIKHYNAAVTNYKTGYTTEAFQEFGRSLHFVEDLSTPVHTNYENFMDAGIKLSMHVEFEKRCVVVQDMCEATIKEENLKYYLNNTKKIIGKTCAYLSADLFYSLEHKLLPQDIIAKHSVLNAQKVVVGLLNRFHHEITQSSNDYENIKIGEELTGGIDIV